MQVFCQHFLTSTSHFRALRARFRCATWLFPVRGTSKAVAVSSSDGADTENGVAEDGDMSLSAHQHCYPRWEIEDRVRIQAILNNDHTADTPRTRAVVANMLMSGFPIALFSLRVRCAGALYSRRVRPAGTISDPCQPSHSLGQEGDVHVCNSGRGRPRPLDRFADQARIEAIRWENTSRTGSTRDSESWASRTRNGAAPMGGRALTDAGRKKEGDGKTCPTISWLHRPQGTDRPDPA